MKNVNISKIQNEFNAFQMKQVQNRNRDIKIL